MNSDIIQKLLQLNQQFYQTFAEQFSATRGRLQPGVLRVLETISSQDTILDLGCGNGELGRELARRGHQGQYLGLDFSPELLSAARAGVQEFPNIAYAQADLADVSAWGVALTDGTLQPSIFNRIFSFAALHHIPGREQHLQILSQIHALLTPGGRFIHSNWQFLNSPRLKARIQPWEIVGLDDAHLDSGDYLLDWRRGGYGLRYVHHFSEEELHALAVETGFQALDSFYSDGQEGNLGLYQIWEKISPK
ncbi:MAG: class I SAM-dependent methyltransferase [Anaerolineae bacterium]|nr:class I SAM-dependent methyltransferase [Anaerolineae bacterium]MBL6965206.1 class I SAM-dependent methyltransferase [Anaerolineales bacterium]